MFKYDVNEVPKFDCDNLTVKDWESLAKFVSSKIKFSGLVAAGGGTNFCDALNKYIDSVGPVIIVNDVFGDGSDLQATKECYRKNFGGDDEILGIVVYSENIPNPSWVKTVFSMGNVG